MSKTGRAQAPRGCLPRFHARSVKNNCRTSSTPPRQSLYGCIELLSGATVSRTWARKDCSASNYRSTHGSFGSRYDSGRLLRRPISCWFSASARQIDPEWFAEAWRTNPEFREEVSHETKRYVLKVGAKGPDQ